MANLSISVDVRRHQVITISDCYSVVDTGLCKRVAHSLQSHHVLHIASCDTPWVRRVISPNEGDACRQRFLTSSGVACVEQTLQTRARVPPQVSYVTFCLHEMKSESDLCWLHTRVGTVNTCATRWSRISEWPLGGDREACSVDQATCMQVGICQNDLWHYRYSVLCVSSVKNIHTWFV